MREENNRPADSLLLSVISHKYNCSRAIWWMENYLRATWWLERINCVFCADCVHIVCMSTRNCRSFVHIVRNLGNSHNPADPRHPPIVGLMLAQRHNMEKKATRMGIKHWCLIAFWEPPGDCAHYQLTIYQSHGHCLDAGDASKLPKITIAWILQLFGNYLMRGMII